jgi:hypothetical protein
MTLGEFKRQVEQTIGVSEFRYGISEPFSWRGSYDEVAFAIIEGPMSKQEFLRRINSAYNYAFYGYKGGEYEYSDSTPVNFEEGNARYTDGKYCAEWIAKIEDSEMFKGQEERLTSLILST